MNEVWKMIRQGIRNKSEEMIEYHFLKDGMDHKQKKEGT